MQELRPDSDTEHLRAVRDRFVAFAFASADILVELDENDHIAFIDGAVSQTLGKSDSMLLGTPIAQLTHPDDASVLTASLADKTAGSRFHDVRVRLHSRHHHYVPFTATGYRLAYLKNHVFMTLSAIKEDALSEEYAKRDMHSGLLRKQSFVAEAGQQIAEAQQPLHVLMLDFPELRTLVETLSPERADALLVSIGGYLKTKSLGGDSAGMISANGYSLVHDGSIDREQVMHDVRALIQVAAPAAELVEIRSHTLQANARLTGHDAANALLYTINRFASQSGDRFSIQSLNEGYQALLKETIEKVSAFKQTVHSHCFDVAFQPIVDLKSGLVHHFEGLVRFNEEHPPFDNAFQFISFGEQTGIIGEFDLAMCQRTLDILKDSAANGLKPLVSVNLSGKSLGSQLFQDSCLALLDRAGDLRKQLLFEITESAKIMDLQATNAFIQTLRKTGSLCCLDNFSMGEASFDYLHNLQVDFVKIDGGYVKSMLSNPRGVSLIRAISVICQELGVTTIGEMVEDAAIAARLGEAGIGFGQGYYFGVPTTDRGILRYCNKPNPVFEPVVRARSMKSKSGPWWSKKA